MKNPVQKILSKIKNGGGGKGLLVAAFLLLSSSGAAWAQSPVWNFAGKKLAFTNGNLASPSVTAEANSPSTAPNNSWYDKNGQLKFYAQYINNIITVYRYDGQVMDSFGALPGAGITLVQRPGTCNQVYIIYTYEILYADIRLFYRTINTDNYTVSSETALGGSIPQVPTHDAAVAVTRPNVGNLTNGNSYLYVLGGTRLMVATISNSGISSLGILFINEPIQVTGHDLAIAHDGTALAWGEPQTTDGKAYINYVHLAPNGFMPTGHPNPRRRLSIPSITAGRINGIQFVPGSSEFLYVTAGADNTTNSGIYRVRFESGTSQSSQYLTGSGAAAQSNIELAYNGTMLVAEANRLRPLHPSTAPLTPGSFGSYISNITTPYSSVRSLPSQIAGWHYNFSGTIIGPHSVHVAGTGANPTATYRVGNTALPGAGYSWSISPSANVSLVQSTSSLNEATITFPSSPLTTYTITVTITNGPCGGGVVTKLVETHNNMFDRIAVPGTEPLQLYPNPAAEVIILETGSGPALATIYDLQGRLLKRLEITHANQRISLLDIPQGAYLLTLDKEGEPRQVCRFAIVR